MPTGKNRGNGGEDGSMSDTESRLLVSALTLFSQKGYEGTTIREIIESAGVTRPVLYYYFANKEDLFRRLVVRWFVEILADYDRILSSAQGCRERLKALIWNGFQRAEHEPEAVRLVLQVFFSPPQEGPDLSDEPLLEERYARLVEVMQDGVTAGELSGGDPEALALAFSGIMDLHVMAKSRYPEIRLTEELATGLVDLFMDGAASVGREGRHLECPFEKGFPRSPFAERRGV